METVSISHFKATCIALLDKVHKTGQPILVTKRGKPVAQVNPPPPAAARPSPFGTMAGTVQIMGDIVHADPADEELWTGDWENVRGTLNK